MQVITRAMFLGEKVIKSKKDEKEYKILSFLPEKSSNVVELFVSDEIEVAGLAEKADYTLTCTLNADPKVKNLYRLSLKDIAE